MIPVNFSKKLSVAKMGENLIENHSCLSEPPVGENSPKISVIVPVYKVEKYLSKCIDSILAQTFTDFELILVDDGSPDNSGKICDDYAARDPRIRVFHKENGGVSSTRNLGLDNARGDWVAFVDSDDVVGEKYLENLWGGGVNSLGPDVGSLVVSGLVYLDEKGRELRRLCFPVGGRPVKEAFRKERLYRFGYPFSKLYDMRIILRQNLRFDPEISMAEDMLFMGDYLRFSKNVMFRESTDYRYYTRVGSLSRRFESFEDGMKLFLKTKKMFEKLNIFSFETQERVALKWFFFRAVFTLYYPPKRPRLELRLNKLRDAYAMLHEEFNVHDCRIHERLFMGGFFKCFDLVMLSFYQLRYRVFGGDS